MATKIDIYELRERIKKGAMVLDVRRPDEYEEGHITGAVNIPIDELENRLTEIPRNSENEICVVCAKGGRGARATKYLNAEGYISVNVDGGTLGWIEAGFDHKKGSEA